MRRVTHVIGTLAALVIAAGTASPAAAQSELVSDGTNAVFFHAGGGTGSDINDINGLLGVTLNGRYDIGTGVSRSTFDGADDLSSLEFSPFASATLVKQNKTTPVSFAVNAGYRNMSFSADSFDDSGVEMSASGFNFGGTLHMALPAGTNLRVIPDAGVTYFTGDSKMTDGVGNELEASIDETVFGFGSAVAMSLPSGSVLSARVGMNVNDEGDSRFVGRVGMTFVFPGGPVN